MAARRRGWLGWLIGLVILIVILWVGYWFAARYAANAALARLNSGPVGGANVACIEPTVGGSPFILDVRCGRIDVSRAEEALTASLGGLAATAPLYWPGSVAANIDGPFNVNMPAAGLALTTNWSVDKATASAGLGGLTAFGAQFLGLEAENTGTVARLPVGSIKAAEATGSIAPAGGGSFAVNASATQLAATRADGTPFPVMDGEAQLTLVGVGGSLGTDPAETILAWLRQGNTTVTIDRLKIAGEGAVVTSDGHLRLSETGKLNGSVLLRWNDPRALADLIEAIMPGTREKADLPLRALTAVSVPVDTPDGRLSQTTLTFTDGAIWLGIFPLPVPPIPPIRF